MADVIGGSRFSGRVNATIGSSSGGGGDGMDTRLTKLETRLDTLLPSLATKADVSEAKADIIKWLAGATLAGVAIIVSVMAFMLNRAVPPQAAAQAASPIVIYPQPAIQQAPQYPPATTHDPRSPPP